MLSEAVNRVQRSSLRGVNRVLRTLSGDPPLPILQTPSAGHCLDTDAAFLLTVGSFLLTVKLFYLQLTILAFFSYNWSFFHLQF